VLRVDSFVNCSNDSTFSLMMDTVKFLSLSVLYSYLFNMTRLGNEKTASLLRCHIFISMTNWTFKLSHSLGEKVL